MHRACVDRARCSDGRRSLRPYDRRGNGSRVLVRLCNELRTALCTAEVVALTHVLVSMQRFRGHRHAAHGILQNVRARASTVCVPVVAVMPRLP
jgi:hypothetical protein